MTSDAHHDIGWSLVRSWIGLGLFCVAFWAAIVYLLAWSTS